MLFKITDSCKIRNTIRNTYINTNHIEAITFLEKDDNGCTLEEFTKIKVHVISGKEFRADIECLIRLLTAIDGE